MLHIETIDSTTLALLKRLQSLEPLKEFYLVGGTALALQLGHRKSVDLDLFTESVLDRRTLIHVLQQEFGSSFQYSGKETSWSLFTFIANTKVDMVHYPYNQIDIPLESESLRLYGLKDIAAMKINAVLGRGQKKDFWAIAALLDRFTLSELFDFHKAKFPSQMLLISLPEALCYFEDAEMSENPISLKEITWIEVKNKIRHHVNKFLT